MNVYVESNFVLELALEQEESDACRTLVELARERRIRLVIPACSMAEPYQTMHRRFLDRQALAVQLERELRQLERTQRFANEVDARLEVTAFLVRSIEAERHRLRDVLGELSEFAALIPLDRAVLLLAHEFEARFQLSAPDALVLASVDIHLDSAGGHDHCFLNRNRIDFNTPEIVALLIEKGCRVIPRFAHGVEYVRAVLDRHD